jgi:hypothetical protein
MMESMESIDNSQTPTCTTSAPIRAPARQSGGSGITLAQEACGLSALLTRLAPRLPGRSCTAVMQVSTQMSVRRSPKRLRPLDVYAIHCFYPRTSPLTFSLDNKRTYPLSLYQLIHSLVPPIFTYLFTHVFAHLSLSYYSRIHSLVPHYGTPPHRTTHFPTSTCLLIRYALFPARKVVCECYDLDLLPRFPPSERSTLTPNP